ncbi:MAG: glycosyltransferase family 2 protein [Thermoflexales bacterium]|nr:glycosyltransferase family 2 protein [Thermoflexales bacterium]
MEIVTNTSSTTISGRPKLVIQIPAYNEESVIAATLRGLPKVIPGVSSIEVIVIDDGSTDRTAEIAEAEGARVVRLKQHQGLARAFKAGLEAALRQGADIIVNTDADNQYNSADIASLIAPLLAGEADIVVGDRGVRTSAYFSPTKRWLQHVGSQVVSYAAGIQIPDATSGFRALSRDAALKLNVLSDHTYTLETLIQAGARGMRVVYVPVRTNPPARPSRLIRSIPSFVVLSAVSIVRFYAMYRPLRMFTLMGSLFIAVGVFLGLRFVFFLVAGQGSGHVQSLLLAAILTIIGFQTVIAGLIADLIQMNRRLLEEIVLRLRRLELDDERKL